MSKIIAATIAFLSLAAVAPAFAAEAPAKVLNTNAVDFRDAAAAQSFYAKLTRTAAAVCDSGSANSVVIQQDRVCAQKALTDAVARLGQPSITALHDRAQASSQYASR